MKKMEIMEKFVQNHYKLKSNFEKKIPKCPQQDPKSNDCGVFVLALSDCISRNINFNFNMQDMPVLRKKITYECIIGELIK